MKMLKFAQSVGVAPGTTTLQLGGVLPPVEREGFHPLDPWARYNRYTPPPQWQLGAIPQSRIRWDLIAVVGGGSLGVALLIGLVASALSK